MPRYKPYSYAQGKFIAIHFDSQILPGTFEYALNHLIDHELDLSVFNARFCNDQNGAPAYDPRILLKIVLYAYSRGIVSSRKIEQACRENVIFMALSADTLPHFTTIADFIASMDQEIVHLFREVLLVCETMGLIGKEMFAIDGCKLSSNAGKEWSGTRADFARKAAKLDQAISHMLRSHRENDRKALEDKQIAREEQYIQTLKRRAEKIKDWLRDHDDKPGKSGKPKKSNITDNDSAKMQTSYGVIQGYDGVTAVDGKHQIIVHAEAFGEAQEHDLLGPMVDHTRANFQAIGTDEDVFKTAKLTADRLFRQRDPRFVGADRYKQRQRQERAGRSKRLFAPADFVFAKDLSHCICPAGKRLYRSGGHVQVRGSTATKFKAPKPACLGCALRSACLRHPEKTEIRQVAYFHGRSVQGAESFTDRMQRKIDSTVGRALYSLRVAIAEPPFAHICRVMGLDRFTLRGRTKVNIQWKLFCIVHNLKKVARYGPQFA